jgi:hypothetical protein
VRLTRDQKLRAAIEALWRKWWETSWTGQGGHTDRDLAIKVIEAARKHGKVIGDDLRVVKAWGPLMVEAKISSSRTMGKSVARLEGRGFFERDNKGRKADKPGAFVFRAVARASVNQYGEEATLEEATVDPSGDGVPCTLHLRTPRLMWSSPKVKGRRGLVKGTRMVRQGVRSEPRPAVKRLGKTRGAILDALDVGGRVLTLQEIADALHRKRARDLRRRNLPMLEEAGIITVDGDVVTLAEDWLDRLEDARELGGEIEAEEHARRRYRDKSRAYHNRQEVEPTHHYVNIPGTDGHVEDLEHIAMALSEADSRTLRAIRAFEDKYGRGAFRWDRASCKELFYSGPIEGFWPEPEELRRIRDYLTAARDVAA